MILKALSILIILLCLISVFYTVYINTFNKSKRQQLEREAKLRYVNKTINLLEKIVKKTRLNPNKVYEVRVRNYYGILKKSGREPFFKDYLTDEDLEQIKRMFKDSRVEIECYYSELSRNLVFNIRYPKPTTSQKF